jgi:hypothetical protein
MYRYPVGLMVPQALTIKLAKALETDLFALWVSVPNEQLDVGDFGRV